MGKEKNDFIRICSFIFLCLAALLIFVDNILPLVGIEVTGTIFNVLRLIKDIALLFGIAFGAYSFAKGAGKTWVIIYWIALCIYIAGAVLGLFK